MLIECLACNALASTVMAFGLQARVVSMATADQSVKCVHTLNKNMRAMQSTECGCLADYVYDC